MWSNVWDNCNIGLKYGKIKLVIDGVVVSVILLIVNLLSVKQA